MRLAIHPLDIRERAKRKMKRHFVEQNSIIAQWLNKYMREEKSEINKREKWQTPVWSQAEISPVTKGTKWTRVGD